MRGVNDIVFIFEHIDKSTIREETVIFELSMKSNDEKLKQLELYAKVEVYSLGERFATFNKISTHSSTNEDNYHHKLLKFHLPLYYEHHSQIKPLTSFKITIFKNIQDRQNNSRFPTIPMNFDQ